MSIASGISIVVLGCVLLCVTLFGDLSSSQDGDGKTDENRPYKFGFNIEGYQHRYEEKDEKGIIMGEYGFITGDGVYHLTVYATDENGNFKIVRTKNVYIGLPGEKTTTPVPAISSLRPDRVREITEKAITMVQGIAGCGGCLIPTTSAPQIDVRAGVEPLRGGGPAARPVAAQEDQGVQRAQGNYGGGARPAEISSPQRAGYLSSTQQGPQSPATPPKPGVISKPNPKNPATIQYRQDNGQTNIDRDPAVEYRQDNEPAAPGAPQINTGQTAPSSGPGQDSRRPTPERNRPVDKLMTNIPKMTSQVHNMEDLQALFYIFNYTLTYHGHHETGNRGGDKNGSYFFSGRDGLGRNVTYVANEFGYQPNITVYDLTEDQTPNEITEKERTKLLGNEFRWFYGKPDTNTIQDSNT